MNRSGKNILFICWDSPSVTYLEGLFVPLFERLTNDYGYSFHVIQFSWATDERIQYLTLYCNTKSITYSHYRIRLKPIAPIGKVLTLRSGSKFIEKYIRAEGIDVVMPRSTMPAQMVLNILPGNPRLKLLFDADGLPIDERVDFAGLKRGSFRFKQLKRIERNILSKSQAVLTRTNMAARILSDEHQVSVNKFLKVINGKDDIAFQFSKQDRDRIRKELGIPIDSSVLVYCGSMGPQYGIDQMLYIYKRVLQSRPDTVFLVITNHTSHASLQEASVIFKNMIIINVSAESIPRYLSAADIAFAIRKDSYSMKGVAPIKLAEYLLMGLPVIASARIGDTEELLSGKPFVFILEDYEVSNLDKAVQWIVNYTVYSETQGSVRRFAVEHYSLSRGAQSYQAAIGPLL